MELILTHTGRLNFTQLERCGRSCESRFRQNFKKSFDWFWSGCAAAIKKGLEIFGISIVNGDAKQFTGLTHCQGQGSFVVCLQRLAYV